MKDDKNKPVETVVIPDTNKDTAVTETTSEPPSKIKMLFILFGTLFKIGLFTFGGGYAMIPLFENEFVSKKKWVDQKEFMTVLVLSESTPGPIAINMATFVGSSQGGLLGAFIATLAIILPAYTIILLISMFAKNVLEKKPIQAIIGGIKPAVIGLIMATAITMFLSIICNIDTVSSTFSLDWLGLIILAVVIITSIVYKKLRKKNISPILLIIISGILGIICYGV